MIASIVHHACVAFPRLHSNVSNHTVTKEVTVLEYSPEHSHYSNKIRTMWLKCAWAQYRWPSGRAPLGLGVNYLRQGGLAQIQIKKWTTEL